MARPPRPIALPLKPENIPDVLKSLPQWVTWRYVWQKGKWDKPPRNARTGKAASSTDPKTWSPSEDAIRAFYHRRDLDGVGCVLTEDNEIAGIDLDNCRNPVTGEIAPWAIRIVQALNSYTEVSPSGTGLRIWLRAKRQKKGRRKDDIEIYSCGVGGLRSRTLG